MAKTTNTGKDVYYLCIKQLPFSTMTNLMTHMLAYHPSDAVEAPELPLDQAYKKAITKTKFKSKDEAHWYFLRTISQGNDRTGATK